MKMKVTFMLDTDLMQIIDLDKGLASRSALVNHLLWKHYKHQYEPEATKCL